MKKTQLLLTIIISFATLFSNSAKAQKHIELSAAKSAQQCQEITAKGFTAAFSFSSIDTREISTEKGTFSEISMSNTFPSGNLGEPSLPAAHQLIAIPFGASNVSIEVKNYSTTIYDLSNYGIKALAPQQASVRKDQEEIPFYYHAEAYQTKGYAERPIAQLELQGTMRGIQIGSLVINPIQYDAASNTIKVFNDIEVEVCYGDYDPTAAYDEFARTASIYFLPMYRQMFNWRDDVYDQHPDLWQAPAKMLVITDRMFEEHLQEWFSWKTTKGFFLDINYTDEIGNTPSAIQTFCREKYLDTAPAFVIIIGDKNQVPASAIGSETHCVTDLYYESVDGDYYPDMLHSRMPVENVQQLDNLLEKSLQYEQYTMPDPSYLNNALLIAGWDEAWNPCVGTPTIQYAVNYYYNQSHGFNNIYDYYNQSQYPGCFTNMNTGVGFVNYTAHGSNTTWNEPLFSVSDVNTLTNTNKYFLAMGNCCLAADWGIDGTCLGEAFVRAPQKGAFAYIGSCPSTYWYEDYYFGVGATTILNQMPTFEQTRTGVYDGLWRDDSYNTIQSMVFIGNLSVTYAHVTGGYLTSSNPLYYWQCYHTLGDASIMPYRTMPTQNHVSHAPAYPIGATQFEVNADPGSYVAISKDGVLYGGAMANSNGIASIELTPITNSGDVTLCVTHPQRIPFTESIPTAASQGACLAMTSFGPTEVHVGEETSLELTFTNVGNMATNGTTTVTITCDDPELTFTNATATFGTLASNAAIELNDFRLIVPEGTADGSKYAINITASCGTDTWTGKADIIAREAVLEFEGSNAPSQFVPGETIAVSASFSNIGHYAATNVTCTITSTSSYVSFEEATVNLGPIDPNGTATSVFHVNISPDCPNSEIIHLAFHLYADGGLFSGGTLTLRNTCVVIFELNDRFGDGWNGATIHVDYSDATPDEDMGLVASQGFSTTYERALDHGVHVTITWNSGNFDGECSYIVRYEDGTVILSHGAEGGSFDVDCGSSNIFESVSNLDATISGNSINLAWDAPTGAIKYHIARNGVTLGDTSTTNYTDLSPNGSVFTYSVTAVYTDGESMPENILVQTCWGSYEQKDEFDIYQNPAYNAVFIDGKEQEFSYFLYDCLGKQITSGTAAGSHQIDVSRLTKGIYIVKICSSGNVMTKKIVIR